MVEQEREVAVCRWAVEASASRSVAGCPEVEVMVATQRATEADTVALAAAVTVVHQEATPVEEDTGEALEVRVSRLRVEVEHTRQAVPLPVQVLVPVLVVEVAEVPRDTPLPAITLATETTVRKVDKPVMASRHRMEALEATPYTHRWIT